MKRSQKREASHQQHPPPPLLSLSLSPPPHYSSLLCDEHYLNPLPFVLCVQIGAGSGGVWDVSVLQQIGQLLVPVLAAELHPEHTVSVQPDSGQPVHCIRHGGHSGGHPHGRHL